MQALLGISSILDRIARSAGKLGGWLIMPLIAVIMFDVVTRKLDFTRIYFSDFTIKYGYSISTILQDLQWHFHGGLLLLSFGFGYLANAHVRVDVFRELAPRRGQAWLELIGLLALATPFMIVLIVYGWDLFHISYLQDEKSDSMTGIDYRYVIKFFMPVGFVLTFFAILATTFRLVVYLLGPTELSREAEDSLVIFADESEALLLARREAEDALRRESGEI